MPVIPCRLALTSWYPGQQLCLMSLSTILYNSSIALVLFCSLCAIGITLAKYGVGLELRQKKRLSFSSAMSHKDYTLEIRNKAGLDGAYSRNLNQMSCVLPCCHS